MSLSFRSLRSAKYPEMEVKHFDFGSIACANNFPVNIAVLQQGALSIYELKLLTVMNVRIIESLSLCHVDWCSTL